MTMEDQETSPNSPLTNTQHCRTDSTSNQERHRRQIKSYVRREGRITRGQERALKQLWPSYGIEYQIEQPLDFETIFGNQHPLWLEIGFGMGQSLANMAHAMPNINFLGIEVHRPGVGSLLASIDKLHLTNVRIIHHDALEVLEHMIAETSLSRVLLFFPDPWPKTRHHKRRLVQPSFANLIASRLKPGGVFHAATDWEPYAQWIQEIFDAHPEFDNPNGIGHFAPKPDYRPRTKFEDRGERLGHSVWDLIYVKS